MSDDVRGFANAKMFLFGVLSDRLDIPTIRAFEYVLVISPKMGIGYKYSIEIEKKL